MICKKLINLATSRMQDMKVKDMRVGLGYVAVMNSAGKVGLAYVLRDRLPHGCSLLENAGNFVGMDLAYIAHMFLDHHNPLKAALGLAAINSVSPMEQNGYIEGEILDLLEIKQQDRVGMIGKFAPVLKKIKEITPNVFVIEENPEYRQNGTNMVFDEIIANCDVMIITATTLINKTFEEIIEKTRNARKKVILGPSTPLFPEFYEGLGIDFASGVIVKDGDRTLQIVGQGGGTRNFKDYVKKVNIKIPQN